MRNLRQKWSYERKFWAAGTLARTIGSLKQLAQMRSILPDEAAHIYRAIEYLNKIHIRDEETLSKSWKEFEVLTFGVGERRKN